MIYGKIKADIGVMLRKLCNHKGVEILEANACKTICVATISRQYSDIENFNVEAIQNIGADAIEILNNMMEDGVINAKITKNIDYVFHL